MQVRAKVWSKRTDSCGDEKTCKVIEKGVDYLGMKAVSSSIPLEWLKETATRCAPMPPPPPRGEPVTHEVVAKLSAILCGIKSDAEVSNKAEFVDAVNRLLAAGNLAIRLPNGDYGKLTISRTGHREYIQFRVRSRYSVDRLGRVPLEIIAKPQGRSATGGRQRTPDVSLTIGH